MRKLVKSAQFIQKQLQRASKAEEAGEQGAKLERKLLSDAFAENYADAVDAIARTEAVATDFDRASIVLKTQPQ